MRRSEAFFANSRGQRIFVRHWLPASAPAAVVVLTHGYAEHSGRYEHVATRFAGAGWAVAALDHHGHGHSDGRRADVATIDHYVDDLLQFIRDTRAAFSDLPVVVCGHSMGGAIVLHSALREPASVPRMLLSAPLVKVDENLSPLLQKIAGFVAAVAPLLPVQPLDSQYISRDPAVIAAYDGDPLIYRGRIRARMGAQMLRLCRELEANLAQITTPFWVGHGTADRLVDPKGSQQLYARATSSDKTLRLYDGCYHEILNEPEQHQVLDDMIAWVRQRL